MVEVFKTNVPNEQRASDILRAFRPKFQHYKANFDLEDCDNILRVESNNGTLKVAELLQFLDEMDIKAEVLPN